MTATGLIGNGFAMALFNCPKLAEAQRSDARAAYSQLLAQVVPGDDELKRLEPDMQERGIRIQGRTVILPPGFSDVGI